MTDNNISNIEEYTNWSI